MSQPVAGIVLAAGKGTRMKSDLPKGLHEVMGLPMVELVARALRSAGVERPAIVIGHGGELIQEALGEGYDYAWQREQHGTGHAVMMAADLLRSAKGAVIVAPGDTPLLSGEVIRDLVSRHCESGATCTVATAEVDDPAGYGRIVRGDDGAVQAIVEDKDCTPEQRAIREVNAAVYCFHAPTLLEILPTLGNANAQGEYYLTDAIAAIAGSRGRVEALVVDDPAILMGVNDRWQLAEAGKALRERINRSHAVAGVTLIDPDSTYIGPDVTIGRDTIVEPETHLQGQTRIGEACRIGPCTKIKNSDLGDRVNVYFSHVNEARLADGVKVGPYANLRPGTELGPRVKVGNFVEIKNSTLGEGSACNHLTYVGDATVGSATNIGAGTITCNYDGFAKHRTTIGSGVFVGSNSTLVAPLLIEDGAMVAAGSVVTHNVPADSLALGRARQEVKEGWVPSWRSRKQPRDQ